MTLEFARALRLATNIMHLTTMVAMCEVGEKVYELFDKVCVIYEGRMAYFGPANQARQYFIDMGFQPEERQTTADFLLAGMLAVLLYSNTSMTGSVSD
jgi:ATP-binding cassette subfamily G (WHITE) protein 2 (SNQ2)